jgi:vacuolar-type H+-ATPase subunit E/Vma4
MNIAVDTTLEKIKDFAKPGNKDYIKLVQKLIVQGMAQMLEPACVVRVRQEDKNAVVGILKDCEQEFSSILKNATNREYNCSLSVDDKTLEST